MSDDNKQENLNLVVGDRIRIYGSRYSNHNTTGTIVSVYRDPNDGTYGIEFHADFSGYEYWKQWTDGGWVERYERA